MFVALACSVTLEPLILVAFKGETSGGLKTASKDPGQFVGGVPNGFAGMLVSAFVQLRRHYSARGSDVARGKVLY
jgi:hypothetical protein